mmetsp:Transcript_20834/g.57352  ORF Transcript_20834/g.57352 Transcript_20834/m.57352 type:complete len:94 (+) Transcript_20834:432-713(+)
MVAKHTRDLNVQDIGSTQNYKSNPVTQIKRTPSHIFTELITSGNGAQLFCRTAAEQLSASIRPVCRGHGRSFTNGGVSTVTVMVGSTKLKEHG